MNVTAILVAALVVGGVGILIGFFLGISGEKFKVEVDERETAILGELPGNNCGGCGYAGCSGLAAAIVKGEAPVNQCPVGGAPVAAKIGEIMGVSAEEGARKVAFVKCAGTCEKANTDYEIVYKNKDTKEETTNPVNAGTYTVSLRGKGNYAGTYDLSSEYTIASCEISKAKVTLTTGKKAIEPKIMSFEYKIDKVYI